MRLGIAICMLLTGCVAGEPHLQTVRADYPRTAQEIEFAKELLNDLQDESIKQNREFCGYIGINPAGELIASNITVGDRASCLVKNIDENFAAVASFHTHGAHSESYDGELPSIDDLESDFDEGVDGYIAILSGRLWLVASLEETAIILCDRGYLHSDPSFIEEEYVPPQTVTIDSLY